MQSYAAMDISLDTFPYAGTTTTCESLYMGVPCVTMAGSTHAHNVGVTLLKQLGERVGCFDCGTCCRVWGFTLPYIKPGCRTKEEK